ncbi:MAG: hypothetical protein QF437_26935, partial [Planctomycetota bacterium]|nr:hypothetical protein [Planctomycetota bacterium]
MTAIRLWLPLAFASLGGLFPAEISYEFMPQECPAAFVLRGRLNINSSHVKRSTLSIAVHHSGEGHMQIQLVKGKASVKRITKKGTVTLAEAKLPSLRGALSMRLFRNQWQ